MEKNLKKDVCVCVCVCVSGLPSWHLRQRICLLTQEMQVRCVYLSHFAGQLEL